MKEKLESIELLRIFCTISIALYHIGIFDSSGISFASGVPILFCISAFLMMLTTETALKKHFLIKRLARLLPLYWLLTIVTFFAALVIPSLNKEGAMGIPELLKSLFLIPYSRSSIKSGMTVRPIVGPGWTMYYDVAFAIIFFVSAKINHKFRGLISAAFCGLLMSITLFFDKKNPFVTVFSDLIWLYFISGICLYYLWKLYKKKESAIKHPVLIRTAGFAAAVGGVCVLYATPVGYVLRAVCTLMIVIGVLIGFGDIRFPAFIVSTGRLSYSFYLIHYFIIIICSKVFDFSAINLKSVLGTVIVIAASYIAAWCSYQIIEKRIVGAFLKKLDKAGS